MSLLKLFGFDPAPAAPAVPAAQAGNTETVRKIVAELEALPVEQARFLAAFAYVLSRAAHADREIDAAETRVMERLVSELGELSPQQAVLVVAIAKNQNRLFGGTESFLVTRELKEISTLEQREHLLHCAFAVTAADDSISSAEEAQLAQIASELGFGRQDFIRVRNAYGDKRAVVQLLKQTAGRI